MDEFFKTEIIPSQIELIETTKKSLDTSSFKFANFRSRRKLERFLIILEKCAAAEQQFLKNNPQIVSNWWNKDRAIFIQPHQIGNYPADYARVFFAQFNIEKTKPYNKIYSDIGLEVFFDTLYPILFNRFPSSLPCNPRKSCFFCFDLKKIIFVPGNARHSPRFLPVLNKSDFNLRDV